MSTVTVYRSSDGSAPSLTGQVGSLLSVLDGCLVNGYGSQSAAGWSKPFANSGNLGCYKNGTGGTGFCLTVNDNAPGAAGAQEARITGFESLSSVSAGSGQFPTSAQSTIGTGQLAVRKSAAASATARNWTVVADPTCFYMFCETGDQTAPFAATAFMFGDFFSYSSTDTSNCMIIGRITENQANFGSGNSLVDGFFGLNVPSVTGLTQSVSGHFAAASYTNVGGSVAVGKHSDSFKMGYPSSASSPSASWLHCMGFGVTWGLNSQILYPNQFNFPNAPDGGLYIAPIWIHHNGYVRGYMKGLWAPVQQLPLNHNDTYTGSNNLSGKSFLAQNIQGGYNVSNSPVLTPAQVHVETSSTWN